MQDIRIGHGYDVHALADGLRLVLGGVEIEHSKGCVAHSDGDVAIHAICDALLGALALAKLLDAGRCVVEKLKAVAWAAGITAGLCLVMIVAGGALFSFGEAESAELLADYLRKQGKE